MTGRGRFTSEIKILEEDAREGSIKIHWRTDVESCSKECTTPKSHKKTLIRFEVHKQLQGMAGSEHTPIQNFMTSATPTCTQY
jgi:hypothetical protein